MMLTKIKLFQLSTFQIILVYIFVSVGNISIANPLEEFKPISTGTQMSSGTPTHAPLDLKKLEQNVDETARKLKESSEEIKRISKQIGNYDQFVKVAGEYSMMAAEITNSYRTFLYSIKDLDSRCQVTKEQYKIKKHNSRFPNLYSRAAYECEKQVKKLTKEVQKFGVEVNTIIETAKQTKEAAEYALTEKGNLMAQKMALEKCVELTNSIKNIKEKDARLLQINKSME